MLISYDSRVLCFLCPPCIRRISVPLEAGISRTSEPHFVKTACADHSKEMECGVVPVWITLIESFATGWSRNLILILILIQHAKADVLRRRLGLGSNMIRSSLIDCIPNDLHQHTFRMPSRRQAAASQIFSIPAPSQDP